MRDFEKGDLVKWKTEGGDEHGFSYATVLDKRPNKGNERWVYTVLFEGRIIDTGFRSYMTLLEEPHLETIFKYRAQLEKEKGAC